MTQDLPELRSCRIEPLGVRLPHGIVDIVLMNVRPGFEKAVIDSIDKRLAIYRKGLAGVEYACSHGLDTNHETYKSRHKSAFERHVQECENGNRTSLLSRAVHATLLSEFQLATIFMSTGYGQKTSLESLDHVLAHRSIQGSVPVPGIPPEPGDFIYLQQQDPDAFLTPFDHGRALNSEAPAEVRSRPLLTICQLQTAGLIRTTDAANVSLPLLYAIEDKMRCVLEDNAEPYRDTIEESACKARQPASVSGLLICSSEWNDYTLLLRSTDLNDATRCIAAIVSITLADLMDRWAALEKYGKRCPEMNDPMVLQRGKFQQRFSRLVRCLSSEREEVPKDARTKNHFFSASTSTPGILWPFAHHAIEALRTQLEGNGDTHTQSAKAFENWSIAGSVRGRVYLADQAGRDAEVSQDIGQILDRLSSVELCGCNEQETKVWRKRVQHFEKYWWLLGYHDKIVPGAFLAPPPGTCSHNLKDLIARTYYLRWRLLKLKPEGGQQDGVRPFPWFGDVAPVVGKDSSALRSLKVEIQCRVENQSNVAVPDYVFHTTSYLQQFCEKAFGVGDPATPRHLNMMALKRRYLSRHLRAAYLQISSRLQHALSDPQESVQALELADAYITWLNAILTAINSENTTTREIEGLTRAFTRPFGHALNQRAIVGFHMTEHTDFTTDLAGGAHKNLTALDGLMKGVMSLIGPPFRVGGLTVVGHGPSAEIQVNTVYENVTHPSQGADREIIYAVCSLNYVHLVHPMTISIVLHEMLHVVVGSSGFKNALRACGAPGEYLASRRDRSTREEPERLDKVRFTEILVEYLLAWLVFLPHQDGEPCLYAQTFLMHLALNIESYGNDKKGSRLIVAEHILRCFLVDQTLQAEYKGQDRCLDSANIQQVFADWWKEKRHFVVDAGSVTEKKYEWVLSRMLANSLKEGVLEPRLCAIRTATRAYFTATDNSYEDSDRSKFCRRHFSDSLRQAQREHTEDVKKKLSAIPPEPVNFVLNDKDFRSSSLRVRRLESLVSNLVLIRSFYGVLCDLLSPDSGGSLHLQRKGASIDFANNAGRCFMLDPTGGALFTVGQVAHMRNIQVRQAFFLSMWHIAEIMKLPGIVSLHELAEELEKADGHLFVFNKPFNANNFQFLW